MQISVIIVNYNTERLLTDCIRSIHQESHGISYEIIVVDNASTDCSISMLAENFPEVKVVASAVNLGFGKANNRGVEEAKGKYLFFLNSDTLLKNNAIRLFFEFMENCPMKSIGVAGSWLLDAKGRPNSSSGVFPTIRSELNYVFSQLGKKKSKTDIPDRGDPPTEVDYVIGADLFMEKKVFEELGGFDPYFFMYYEESDLQRRMCDKGLKRVLIEGPRIVHLEGGSFSNKGLTLSRFMMAQTSFNYYIRKYYRGVPYCFFRIVLVVLRLALFFTTDWTFKEKCKAYKLVLKKSL